MLVRSIAWLGVLALSAVAQLVPGAPTLTTLHPSQLTTGSGPRGLAVEGSGFVPSSLVLWDGIPMLTAYRGPQLLEATVDAGFLQSPATAVITVVTPPPGGGTSAPHALTVVACGPDVGFVAFGSVVGDEFGRDLEFVGDVDGDGGSDLLVGSVVGKRLISGATGIPISTLGLQQVWGCGDVDGDARGDLATFTATGGLEVFSGTSLGGVPIRVILGIPAVDQIRGLGDVDGDGRDDFAVVGADRLTVVSGASGTVQAVLLGAPGEDFGAAFDGSADLSGDGQRDLLVSAPGAGIDGLAYVYASDTWTVARTLLPTFGGFGRWIRDAGDFDGDGTTDTLVTDGPESTLFSGSTGLALGAPDANLGVSLGDLDGDGDGDLLLGDPGSDLAWILGGSPTFQSLLFREFRCATSGDGFGRSVAAGDANGDGHIDVAIGADQPGASAPAGAGYVKVWFGPLATLESLGVGCGPGLAPRWSLGLPRVGQTIDLEVSAAPPGATGFLAFSPGPPLAPLSIGSGCFVRVDPGNYDGFPFQPDATGHWTLGWYVPIDPALLGAQFQSQVVFSGGTLAGGLALSNAVTLRIGF